MEKKIYDLEERLINYTCAMIDLVEALPGTKAGNYIGGQLIRSSHSPAFNYGEVQAAESRNDFVHKLKIVLKELKECRVALKIITKKELIKDAVWLKKMAGETEELIAIIAKSIETANRNGSKMRDSDLA